MKNQKGITLITLVVTMVIMLILTVTISVNYGRYKMEAEKASFEEDMNSLREAVEHYYAQNKELPVINRYGYTAMFQDVKNVNDNNVYYVIDIRKLDVNLHFGKDFDEILTRSRNAEILDLVDVYIINEQSHTIYYPKGIIYGSGTLYTFMEKYTNVKDKVNTNIQG